MPYFPPPFSISSANPTASVGLTAVNGSAATFMRSDSAPPLDQTAAFAFSNLSTTTIKGLLTVAPTSNAVAPAVFNAASGFVGLLLDAQLASTSYFRVSAVNTSGATAGQVFILAPAATGITQYLRMNSGGTANGPGFGTNANGSQGFSIFGTGATLYMDVSSSGVNVSPAIGIGFTSSTANVTSALPDAFITRGGVATLTLGAIASSTASVAQRLQASGSSAASATGPDFTIAGSSQSGTTSIGGDLFLTGGTGTSSNGYVKFGTITANALVTAAGTIAIKDAGGTLRYLMYTNTP